MTKTFIGLDDVKQEFISRGYTPLFTKYKNLDDKLLASDRKGYKFYTTLRKIRNEQNSSLFHKSNPYAIYNIELWIKHNNLDYSLISKEYYGSDKKLELKCKKHGSFFKTWDNMKQGQGCPICAKEKLREKFKLSYEDIKKEFQSKGYTLISTNYINAQQKLKYICNRHKDKGIQAIKYGHFQQGHGCKYCAIESITGSYNLSTAERNKEEWLSLDATVYIIKCYNNNEQFYKIGITTDTIKGRFLNGGLPYNYSIINTIETDLYNAIYLEDKLHKLHEKYSYTPKIEFSGYTECFTQLNMKYIKELAS